MKTKIFLVPLLLISAVGIARAADDLGSLLAARGDAKISDQEKSNIADRYLSLAEEKGYEVQNPALCRESFFQPVDALIDPCTLIRMQEPTLQRQPIRWIKPACAGGGEGGGGCGV